MSDTEKTTGDLEVTFIDDFGPKFLKSIDPLTDADKADAQMFHQLRKGNSIPREAAPTLEARARELADELYGTFGYAKVHGKDKFVPHQELNANLLLEALRQAMNEGLEMAADLIMNGSKGDNYETRLELYSKVRALKKETP